MSGEFLSNVSIEILTGTSPETYVELENPEDGVTVGQSTPLVRVTNLTDTSERYIGGLADGDEFTVTVNRLHGSPSIQDRLISRNGLNETMRVKVIDKSKSPEVSEQYDFEVVNLNWSLQPSLGEASKIAFTFKISGDVEYTPAS